MILRYWVWQVGDDLCWLRAAFDSYFAAVSWVKANGRGLPHQVVDTGSTWLLPELNRRLADLERRVDERIALRRSEAALTTTEREK